MKPWVIPVVLCAMTFVCFLPALGAGFVNWDDDKNFELNEHYRGLGPDNLRWMFTTTHMGLYMPVTWMTLGLDYLLWGMNPQGYHLTNLLLHVLAAFLLFTLLRKLFRSFGEGGDLAAAAGALLFAIHPLRVESVAWVTERRDMVSTCFFLLSILAYFRSREGSYGRWLAASLGCFLLALLSKSIVLTLPAVLLILDEYPLRKRALREKIPYVALSLLFALITLGAQKDANAMAIDYPILDSVLQPGFRACFYLWKTALPFGLVPLYPMDYVDGPFDPPYLLATLLVIGVSGVLFHQRRRLPAAAACWFAYLVLLSPVLGFVQAGPQQVADRYSYLSCLPFAALLGGWILTRRRPGAMIATAGVLVAFGILTLLQSQIWSDSITLWGHTLERVPSVIAYKNHGLASADAGRLDVALADFDKAIEMEPGNFQLYSDRADIHRRRGDVDRMFADANRAIQGNPTLADAYAHRGLALAMRGNPQAGLADMRKAFELGAASPKNYLDRGIVRQFNGDWDGAIEDYSLAIRLRPLATTGYWNRAQARRHQGKLDAAEADLSEIIRLNPNDATVRVNRGLYRGAQGKLDGAIEDYTEAIRLEPNNVKAWYGRATTRLEKRDAAGALADYEAALRVAPANWPLRRQVEAEVQRLRR